MATKTQLDPDNNTTVNPGKYFVQILFLRPPFSFSESDYAILIMICSVSYTIKANARKLYAASLAQSSTPC